MSSVNAENVAREVLETIGKGKKVKLGEIALRNGYATTTAENPKLITTTKAYQGVVKPLVEQLEEERLAIMERLKVTRDKAKYRDLMDGLDKVTKTHQLLTGGATANIAVRPIYGGQSIQRHDGDKEDIPA